MGLDKRNHQVTLIGEVDREPTHESNGFLKVSFKGLPPPFCKPKGEWDQGQCVNMKCVRY